MNYQERKDALSRAIARFPETFRLKAFPGETFRVSKLASFVSDAGRPVLYVQTLADAGGNSFFGGDWVDFAKSTESELESNIVRGES